MQQQTTQPQPQPIPELPSVQDMRTCPRLLELSAMVASGYPDCEGLRLFVYGTSNPNLEGTTR